MQDLSGRKLGQFELRERLGRGGMAEVYKAYQSGIDRFIAIKVMLGSLNEDESFIERFRREARAIGNLRHAHIVQAIDFGIEDGLYYLAMEFVEGGDLKEFIQERGKLPPRDALRITSQLADALAYAHDKGMVHRDLKPANVMFLDTDGQHAILTDFGIARIMGEAGLTGTGMAVGTPDYMSPEAGQGLETDHRTDIYALGVILFEMLVGEVPYSADTPLAVIMKHINAPLPSIIDYEEDIPDIIEPIIEQTLAKDPDDRYQSASDMKAEIDTALAQLDNPTTASQFVKAVEDKAEASTKLSAARATALKDNKPTEAISKAEKPKTKPTDGQNNNTLLIGAGAVAVIAIVAVVAFFVMNNQTMPVAEPTLAPADLTATTIAAALPSDEPIMTPSDTSEATIAATALPTEEPADPQSAEAIITPPHPDNLNLLTGESTLMDSVVTLLMAGRFERAEANLTTSLANNPDNLVVLFARSQLNVALGNIEQARIDAEDFIALAPDRAAGYIALSEAYMVGDEADYDAAGEALQRAFEIAPDSPQVMWRRVWLDVVRSGSIAGMQETFDEAEANGASGWRFVIFAGRYLYIQGEYARALPYLEHAVNDIPRRLYNAAEYQDMHMDTLFNLGMVDAEAMDETIAANDDTEIDIPFDAVLPPHPDNLMLTSGIAQIVDAIEVLLAEENQEDAIAMANGFLDDNPDAVFGLFARSLAYAYAWDEDHLALEDANRIIELEPENPFGYIALGHAHLTHPDYDAEAAIQAFEQANELDSGNIHVAWRRAVFSDSDVQIDLFNEAEANGARGWQFITQAAYLLYDYEEWERAIPYLYVHATEELNGEYEYWLARFRLMGALIQTGQEDDAYELAQTYRSDVEDAEGYVYLAYVAYRAQEWEQAKAWANTALALDGDLNAARYILALVAWWGDADAEAAVDQLNALEDEDFYSLYTNFVYHHDINLDRARILTDAGRVEEGLEFYDAVLEDYSYTAWLYEERADSHLDLGDVEAARDDLNTARDIAEDDEYRQELLDRIIELGPAPTSEAED